MISLVKILNEMSRIDYVSKALQQVYEKYKDSPDKGYLYINFDNRRHDVIMKYAVSDPSHQDPVGIYAYPLEYIIKNIDNIPYAANRKYVRVIKDKSKKMLYITKMTYSEVEEKLLQVHKDLYEKCHQMAKEKAAKNTSKYEIDFLIKYMQQKFPGRIESNRANWEGRLFLQCIQWDFCTGHTRTPQEQTRLLIKLGYDAIEDDSEHGRVAVINYSEPTQTIFLRRDAFDIIEVLEQDEENAVGIKGIGRITKPLNNALKEMGLHLTRKRLSYSTATVDFLRIKEYPFLFMTQGKPNELILEFSRMDTLDIITGKIRKIIIPTINKRSAYPIGKWEIPKIEINMVQLPIQGINFTISPRKKMAMKIIDLERIEGRIYFDFSSVPSGIILEKAEERAEEKEVNKRIKTSLPDLLNKDVKYFINIHKDEGGEKNILEGTIKVKDILSQKLINKFAGTIINLREKQKRKKF